MTSTASVPAYLRPGVTVVHPSHLEGDPSLATEILPGPPSLASIRQPPKKVDPKRPAPPISYLPTSDPGTTYTGLAGGMAPMEVVGPRRKRARVDKGPMNRTQRSSVRGLTSGAPPDAVVPPVDNDSAPSQPIPEPDPCLILLDDEYPSLSRSVSSQNLGEGSSKGTNGHGARKRGRPKGKGKEREKETEAPVILVKEEPVTTQIPEPPPAYAPPNEDHCSSCTSLGALVYCDGCPRAFHLWCLDPPMEATDLPEGDDRWYCPSCKLAQRQMPQARGPPSFLSPLIRQLQASTPVEFQLPEDIRTFFRDVTTGPRGAYIDNSNFKPPRVGRHGLGEERDPYRLRDSKGASVLCFRCGKSALPNGAAASVPPTKRARRSSILAPGPEQWKTIITCDYCSLHWHLDCLEPPLPSLPPFGKKWKCPNHASNVAPKRRLPKIHAPPIEINGPNQFNNGNIEILSSETPVMNQKKILVDEVLINGRRYRVPERVIVLDFWSKVRHKETQRTNDSEYASVTSSPLTSLSSLDDVDDPPSVSLPSQIADDDTLSVAQLLCSMQSFSSSSRGIRRSRNMYEKGIQTEPDNSVRLERKDTEHLSGLMKAAFKEAPSSASKPVLDSTRKVPNPKHNQSSSSVSSLAPTKRAAAANGKTPSRTSRTAPSRAVASPATPSLHGAQTVFNGRHATGTTRVSARTTPRPAISKTSSLNDIDVKADNTPSLKIRIPRLSTLNGHSGSQPSVASSSLAVAAPKLVGASPAPTLLSRAGPRRSLRRQNSASGLSGAPSTTTVAPSSKLKKVPLRQNSEGSWHDIS